MFFYFYFCSIIVISRIIVKKDEVPMQSANKQYRIIFHIDLNCFFASCEIANNQSLQGKPIVIARNDTFKKGIVLTATYEARKFGIYTTMILREALKLCPNVIIIEPNHELYKYYSRQFFDYLYSITKKVEVVSVDEGYLDVTDLCEKMDALELAKKIQKDLLNEYSLPCSIGIAPNKFLAKMASDMKKPLGITVLRKREIKDLLWPLPINAMYGIGKKTAPKLNDININTIGDLVGYNDSELLKKTVGNSMYEYLLSKANGNDNEEVKYENIEDASSISNSSTFDFEENNPKTIKDVLRVLTNTVCFSLEKTEMFAYNVGIQIKYSDMRHYNRSKGLEKPISLYQDIWPIIEELFDEHYEEDSHVRLVGVFATRLDKGIQTIKQYSLFDDLAKVEKENEIHNIIHQLNGQFGSDVINIGIKKDVDGKNNTSRKPIFTRN